MIINTKYFGLISDITNKKEEQIVLENFNTTVSFLKSVIESNYPDLKKTTYSIAVNQAIVPTDFMIKEQDTIAFLPPFAGG
ncbi:MoaD/ThiS family protein [Flavobacterium sp.]|uniref:MoaD/ThiS family protein n=1 Tax=Flavobacterium sp. TaxID=239 RepID=UPI003C48EED9